MTTVTFDKTAADLMLSKAKIAVMKDRKLVFFSVLMMNMRYGFNTSIPTAATDGKTIWINPISYKELTPGQRVSRLMHEVMHTVLLHFMRKGARNHSKWNRAGDYYINLMLTDAGFEKISTWLWDDKYRGMTTEQIYDALPDAEEPEFDPDLLEAPEDSNDDVPDKVKYAMDKLVLQASVSAQTAGCGQNIPSDIAFYLHKLLHPKLRWDIILKRWFSRYIKKGYTWTKPNKRYEQYMPSRGSPALDDAAFATDISGSVSDDDYNAIIGNVSGVFTQMKPNFIHYIQFSETITSNTKVKNLNQLKKIEFVGRDGTDVRELFEWANKHMPRVMVILTDGGFYWPREGGNVWDESIPLLIPKCDVVWLIHDNPDWTAPYGKVIHYEINK